LKFAGRFIKVRVRGCEYCGKQFRSKEVIDAQIQLPSSASRNQTQSALPVEEEDFSLPEKPAKPPKEKKSADRVKSLPQKKSTQVKPAKNPFL
jgi:hypothetical protein